MKWFAAVVRPAACALSFALAVPALAQATEPAMHTALERLAASQNLDANWSLVLRNVSSAGPDRVLRGASDAIDANPVLSPAQRDRARRAVAALAPQIAADIDAMHAKLDVKALTLDMLEAVYPKYYTLREIQEMTSFYDTPASRKALSIGVQAKAEISRTGLNPALVWARYEARFTPEEKRFLASFQNSATGKKMRSVGPRVNEEGLRFMRARTDGMLNEIVARYQDRVERTVRELPQD